MNKKVIALIAILVVLTISYVVLENFDKDGSDEDLQGRAGVTSSVSSIYNEQTSSLYSYLSSQANNTSDSGTHITSSKKSLTSSQVNSAKDKLISDLNGLKE